MGIQNDQYQEDWKSRLRREKGFDFHKFSPQNSCTSSGDVARKLRVQRARLGVQYVERLGIFCYYNLTDYLKVSDCSTYNPQSYLDPPKSKWHDGHRENVFGKCCLLNDVVRWRDEWLRESNLPLFALT